MHSSGPPADSSNEDFLFHLYRGSELLQDNRVHEAKEELERALELQPRDAKGQDLIAAVYFRLGLYARAVNVYEQLRQRNAGDPALLLNLALCYLKMAEPALARRELEQLLVAHPTHARAWGYLGVACERMGDLAEAEHAFEQGGHTQMARRVASRRGGARADPSRPSQAVRDAAGTAFAELDAGELSFAIAEPSDSGDAAAKSWRPHELGHLLPDRDRPDTQVPDTRQGPRRERASERLAEPSIPQLWHPPLSLNRRPTLLAPALAPSNETGANEPAVKEPVPSQPRRSASASTPPGEPRRPVVAVPSPFGPARPHERPEDETDPTRTRTLAPPGPVNSLPDALAFPAGAVGANATAALASMTGTGGSAAAELLVEGPSGSTSPVATLAPTVHFPEHGAAVHRSGVALVHTTPEVGFVVRLEAVRVRQGEAELRPLGPTTTGKATGEALGTAVRPMVMASGEGDLVLGPRPGRRLAGLTIDEIGFIREDVLVGFEGKLAFERGRLTIGQAEHVSIVQLRGSGVVLLELLGDVLTLAAHPDRSLLVRREAIVGWLGRLVPRALPPEDAPCGQRGLVSLSGEGRVFVASR